MKKGARFFILDEILKGTNSADKSKGSLLFLEEIIKKMGTGLIATHDTSLGKMESDHPGAVINKCFEIEIDGENIRFDYKIQEGITQKMNAVFLMNRWAFWINVSDSCYSRCQKRVITKLFNKGIYEHEERSKEFQLP